MSYDIEYDRVVLHFNAEDEYGYEKQFYLLANKVGSSNVIDHDDTIATNWNYITIGTESEVITHLATFANAIESDYLRYRNGKTKIENYLSNWRNTLSGSDKETRYMSLADIDDRFYKHEFIYRDTTDVSELSDDTQRVIQEIKNTWRRTKEDGVLTWRCDITPESAAMIMQIRNETSISATLESSL